MKYLVLLILFTHISLFGCSPIRKIGDPIGGTIAEVSDELGAERTVGKDKDDDTVTIHPQGDKKIKMKF